MCEPLDQRHPDSVGLKHTKEAYKAWEIDGSMVCLKTGFASTHVT